MAWAVLRGRSVMYRWHATSTGMIPKTLGAMAVENSGQPEITTAKVETRADERSSAARGPSPVVLDVRGDESARSDHLPESTPVPQTSDHTR